MFLIVSFLFYVIVIGSTISYFRDSDSLWVPAIQSILWISLVFFITRKFLKFIISKIISDIRHFFSKKEIEIIKEDGSYCIVKKTKKKFSFMYFDTKDYIDFNLTEEEAKYKFDLIKKEKNKKVRLKKLKRLSSI